jgi:hypothetical protein
MRKNLTRRDRREAAVIVEAPLSSRIGARSTRKGPEKEC